MSERVNPDDFVITRKRKKYKFAKFANAANCYEFDQWQPRPIDVVEVGAGTGLFSVELARRYPEKQFLAIDVKADRLQKGAYTALEAGLSNIWFLRARADQLDEILMPESVSQVWLTFADPFMRPRSAGRRLTHPTFLGQYARALTAGGAVLIKHDNFTFFTWSLEQLVRSRWNISELSFDLQQSDLSQDYKIMTTYEQRWQQEGRVTNFVKATKPATIHAVSTSQKKETA